MATAISAESGRLVRSDNYPRKQRAVSSAPSSSHRQQRIRKFHSSGLLSATSRNGQGFRPVIEVAVFKTSGVVQPTPNPSAEGNASRHRETRDWSKPPSKPCPPLGCQRHGLVAVVARRAPAVPFFNRSDGENIRTADQRAKAPITPREVLRRVDVSSTQPKNRESCRRAVR